MNLREQTSEKFLIDCDNFHKGINTANIWKMAAILSKTQCLYSSLDVLFSFTSLHSFSQSVQQFSKIYVSHLLYDILRSLILIK